MARRRGCPLVGPESAGPQQRRIPPAVISVRASAPFAPSQIAQSSRGALPKHGERKRPSAQFPASGRTRQSVAAGKRTALMRPPPDVLLRGGQLAPALANE